MAQAAGIHRSIWSIRANHAELRQLHGRRCAKCECPRPLRWQGAYCVVGEVDSPCTREWRRRGSDSDRKLRAFLRCHWGYGSLGVIVEVTLSLTDDTRVERKSVVMPLS